MMDFLKSDFMGRVTNTPGFIYGAAYCLGTLVIILANRKKLRGWRLALNYVLFAAIVISAMILTDGIIPRPLFIPFEIAVYFAIALNLK